MPLRRLLCSRQSLTLRFCAKGSTAADEGRAEQRDQRCEYDTRPQQPMRSAAAAPYPMDLVTRICLVAANTSLYGARSGAAQILPYRLDQAVWLAPDVTARQGFVPEQPNTGR
jgi:hypothetical protein